MKWYERLFLFLLIIIALPFILLSFAIFSICYPFIILYNLISYKKSAYYKAFNIPFTKKIFNSNEYTFYNYSVKENLPITYHKQKIKHFIILFIIIKYLYFLISIN